MTIEEVTKIIFILRANYPEAYSKLSSNDLELLSQTWAALLKDYTYEDANMGIQNYMVNDIYGRAPKVGQIIDSIKKLNQKEELNPNAAWALVYKAICNSNYNAEDEYNKLPPVVQKAVGHFHNLRDYAQMSIEDVQVTVKAHFKSVYEVEMKREKEREKLPQVIKDRIDDKNNIGIEAK